MAAAECEIREFLVHTLHRIGQETGVAVEEIADDFSLLESGLVDSYGFMDLLSSIERRFELEIDLGALDPEQFFTLGGLIQCCQAAVEA